MCWRWLAQLAPAAGPASLFAVGTGVRDARGLRSQQSEVLKLQEQFAADPGIRGGVGDLRRGQAWRGPVRGARAFGNAKAQEDSCEIAQTGLGQAAAPGDDAEVEHI